MTTCADHTPAPESYLHWHSWAQRMSKAYRQITCDECNRWAIWVPKRLPPAPRPPSAAVFRYHVGPD